MIYLVGLKKDGNDDIMADQLKVRIAHEGKDVSLSAREKIVQTYYRFSPGKERFNQMAADESGATCNNDIFHQDPLPNISKMGLSI
jgi:hypothetical protein